LTIRNLRPGAHVLRARLKGKREITQKATLAAGAQTVQLSLTIPAEEAERHFQTAEALREAGQHAAASREYRQAIRRRPAGYPAARVALARSLIVLDGYEEAVAQLHSAIRERQGNYAEAYVVFGNLRRSQGFHEEAFKNYRIALTQARDFSPEAYTGLALTYQDLNRSQEAIKHLALAAAQSNGTEPIIYFLLGNALEREDRIKEAVAAYEVYLRLEPQGAQAGAVRSIVKMLKKG
jgi:tetratricopeptide (TPR) repeat protein